MKRKFTVTGMTCSACSSHVERAVGKADGVRSVSVNLLTGTMQVDFDENVINEDGIAAVVKGAGYGAYAEQSDSAQSPKSKPDKNSEIAGRSGARVEETRKMRVRLIVSLVFTVLLMYVAMGHMAGAPLPSFLVGTGNAVSYALVQLLLCLPVIYVNRVYYINGFRRLVRLSPNMDSLIAVGSAASLVYGIFVIFRMSYALGAGDVAVVERYMHDLYFESAAMILALVTVGKYLESVSRRRTGDALDKLIGLAPDTAVVIRDGRETAVNSADLSVGDEIVVRAGAAVPADAVVTEGNAFMDESAISGESVPVEKSEGDGIIGGTVNRSGYVVARVTAVGGDSMLAKIVKLVEDAGASKAPIASAADKIAGFFVPVVMAVAVVTLAGWLIAGYAFEHAFTCAVSVLVISCPCALGLATPVAVMVGTGKGAESGVLFKSGEALQNMHDVKVVALDKTGTVTEGTPEVSEVSIARDAEEILAAVAAIEKRSEHPLGTAVVAYAERNGMGQGGDRLRRRGTLRRRKLRAYGGRGRERRGIRCRTGQNNRRRENAAAHCERGRICGNDCDCGQSEAHQRAGRARTPKTGSKSCYADGRQRAYRACSGRSGGNRRGVCGYIASGQRAYRRRTFRTRQSGYGR